jgi:hypothetical protein
MHERQQQQQHGCVKQQHARASRPLTPPRLSTDDKLRRPPQVQAYGGAPDVPRQAHRAGQDAQGAGKEAAADLAADPAIRRRCSYQQWQEVMTLCSCWQQGAGMHSLPAPPCNILRLISHHTRTAPAGAEAARHRAQGHRQGPRQVDPGVQRGLPVCAQNHHRRREGGSTSGGGGWRWSVLLTCKAAVYLVTQSKS